MLSQDVILLGINKNVQRGNIICTESQCFRRYIDSSDPFGMNMQGLENSDFQSETSGEEHKWQYNGKEKQEGEKDATTAKSREG